VLEQLATPTAPPVLQHKAELIDLVVSAPPGAVAAAPPSVALGVFQTAWPMLQQASALLLPLRDAETLGVVVRIYASAIPLLYPHELGPLLGALVQAGLALYAVLPLPAVLDLLDRAVGAHNFGAAVDMRDMWNSALTQVYKCTMINTKVSGEGRRDTALSVKRRTTPSTICTMHPFFCSSGSIHTLLFFFIIIISFHVCFFLSRCCCAG
jgi:hypothetical protein